MNSSHALKERLILVLRCLVAGGVIGAGIAEAQMPTGSPDSLVLLRTDPQCAPDLVPCLLPPVVLRRLELPSGTMDTIAARAFAAGVYQQPRDALRRPAWCEVTWSDARMATLTIHHGERAWTVSGFHACAGARSSVDPDWSPPERERLVALEALVDSVARLRRLPP